MKTSPLSPLRPIALAVVLAFGSGHALADAREDLEVQRQTVLNLIKALVEQGVLTREKAAELIRNAEEKAVSVVTQQREKERAPIALAPGAAGQPAASATPAPVRVQYIPESVKQEIRDQLRREVLNQAREERWADRNAIPSWLDNLKFGGDILTRYQFDNFASSNTPPAAYDQSGSSAPGLTTRNAAFANSGLTSGNTQNDVGNFRVRARLLADVKIGNDVTAGLRIASGNSDSRVSTTQTLSGGFNKYSLWLDRSFIRYQGTEWLAVQTGRMPNPFANSELLWDDNVNFDGIAFSLRDRKADGFVPYATLGAFPIATESAPRTTFSRTLFAAQIGALSDLSTTTRGRAGIAYYRFRNLEGRPENSTSFTTGVGATTNTYGSSEYGSSLRQKGNTLVRINAPTDTGSTTWGLASKFAPLHLGAGIDWARSDRLHFVVSADYVKNLAYDRAEIERRTGVALRDGKSSGYQARALIGAPQVRRKGEWNASLIFRHLGSDAVPDAFADGTLGGGGTNVRGYILGFTYGLDRSTTLAMRYLSGRNIDSQSMLSSNPGQLRLNSVQVDLGVGF